MKGSELKKLLKDNGCEPEREGKNHEIWKSRRTGKKFAVPRHDSKDIPDGTVKNIMRSAGIE